MHSHRLDDMTKGWFVGDFLPTAHVTQACEVGLKTYAAGAFEGRHFHKVATEVTLVVSGRVHMAGRDWGAGDVVVIEPGEATDFRALSDAITVVVKVPGQLDDKFVLEE